MKKIEVAEGQKTLHLDGATLPEGMVLPASLEWISLGGGTLPEGTVLPVSCTVYR
ncbi:MAG: hypothetical protein JKY67_00395 [Pseudomonadales bacterium]|nr:hypothetical protein [Pseudomonadales bacterium]MBL4864818.1 hypothetical protein [Pseudomonadales bacterium]